MCRTTPTWRRWTLPRFYASMLLPCHPAPRPTAPNKANFLRFWPENGGRVKKQTQFCETNPICRRPVSGLPRYPSIPAAAAARARQRLRQTKPISRPVLAGLRNLGVPFNHRLPIDLRPLDVVVTREEVNHLGARVRRRGKSSRRNHREMGIRTDVRRSCADIFLDIGKTPGQPRGAYRDVAIVWDGF
jgi:hypothetical protein